MNAAVWPRAERDAGRLLHIDSARGTLTEGTVADLSEFLAPSDLLVLNDAATLPGSFRAHAPEGEQVEVRLANPGGTLAEWTAVLFGSGDWRQRTEDRPPPPAVAVGARLDCGDGFMATVSAVSPLSPRLLELRFEADGARFLQQLYRHGRPVQYSYLAGPLRLRHVQTAFASRPWAVEMPSAAWSLSATALAALRRRGVAVASLTLAAGLSATGDPAIDALLPLPERYEIPSETVEAIAVTRRAGGRIVAVGTTVVRALESSAADHDGLPVAGAGKTDLRLGAGRPPRMVDGLLTGVHEPGASHFDVLAAFVPPGLLERAQRHAESAGYLTHEFGDSVLVLPRRTTTGH